MEEEKEPPAEVEAPPETTPEPEAQPATTGDLLVVFLSPFISSFAVGL